MTDTIIRTLEEGPPEAAGFRPEQIRRIDERLGEWVAEGRTPAISALIARRGTIVLHKAYGQQSPEAAKGSLRTDHIWPVMSVTKPFIATAAMMLVEEGRLSLNRRLRDYIPEVEGKWTDEILIHHLMTHSAGYNEWDLFAWVSEHPLSDLQVPDSNQHPVIHDWLEHRYKAPLTFRPGSENSYGIHCIMLLGEVVRRISGQSTEEFLKERILAPLGMQDSGMVSYEHMKGRFVTRGESLVFGNDDSLVNLNASWDVPAAGGGLLSTPYDLAIWAQTFLNGGIYNGQRILGEWTTREMMRNQIPGVPARGWGDCMVPEASWGLGWMIQGDEKWPYWTGSLQPNGTVYHQGIGASFLWLDPLNDIIGVYLTIATKADMEGTTEHNWDLDKFQNMVYAAIA